MKVCSNAKCDLAGAPQPPANFYRHKQTRDGLTSWCKVCTKRGSQRRQSEREAAKTRALANGNSKGGCPKKSPTASSDLYAARKARYPAELVPTSPAVRLVRVYKTKSRCESCGESDPACLDLHHRVSDVKSFSLGDVSQVATRTLDEVRDEILKCDVLCANCHRKLHAGVLKKYGTFRRNREEVAEQKLEESYWIAISAASSGVHKYLVET